MPIGLKYFVGTQEIIIYRLLLRNQWYDMFIFRIRFFGPYWRENERGRHQRAWGLKTWLKYWPTVWTFWFNHYLKNDLNYERKTGASPRH